MDRTPDGSEAGGGGAPPLDLRVARLYDGVAEMTARLRGMDAKPCALDTELTHVAEPVAELRGRLSQHRPGFSFCWLSSRRGAPAQQSSA